VHIFGQYCKQCCTYIIFYYENRRRRLSACEIWYEYILNRNRVLCCYFFIPLIFCLWANMIGTYHNEYYASCHHTADPVLIITISWYVSPVSSTLVTINVLYYTTTSLRDDLSTCKLIGQLYFNDLPFRFLWNSDTFRPTYLAKTYKPLWASIAVRL